MLARTIMVQGTASSVGKSLLVTALCRIFKDAGLKVAPFKSQNMALNSAVTWDGLEIGRAQAVQAEAAGARASVHMNPILLKPEGDRRSQVVVLGKPIGSLSAVEYHAHKPQLSGIIAESLGILRATHDVVVIEGAGSPAEINLKDRDIVNMHVAELAQAPVLLVGDIDKGGVFAAFVGTLELLSADERARVAAFIVNKFRGDLALLTPGLTFLHERTGKPVLGVVPFVPKLRIADEDSLGLDARAGRVKPASDKLDIVVVRLPRISNYDDVEALEHEASVVLRFTESATDVAQADLAILPGSKSSVADLAWLRASGIASALQERAAQGAPTLGICGGCQMLGLSIHDPHAVESDEAHAPGLGLQPLSTHFSRQKLTAQVRARSLGPSFLTDNAPLDVELSGYEIHMGTTRHEQHTSAAFQIEMRNGQVQSALDGAVAAQGAVVGTMLHGLFENDALRARTLSYLRRRARLAPNPQTPPIPTKQAEYARVATTVRNNLDMALLWRLLESGTTAQHGG